MLCGALARVPVALPPAVLAWVCKAAHPNLVAWRALLARPDLTADQAWNLLWRDGAIEASAEKIPGSWIANASSQRLAEPVAIYLARPDTPAGTLARVREQFDTTTLLRLDLLYEVVRLGGSDTVCEEIVAEPPAGSRRDTHLGKRELTLLARYRSRAREEAERRQQETDRVVATICAQDTVPARVPASSVGTAGDSTRILRACLFGDGSVVPNPADVDLTSAWHLHHLAASASVYQPNSDGLGEALSAVRPILRSHVEIAEAYPMRYITRRLLGFGPASAVPLGFSVLAEQGQYVLDRLGGEIDYYQGLAEAAVASPDLPLRNLCDLAVRTRSM